MNIKQLKLKENMIVLDAIETWGEIFHNFLKNNKSSIFGYLEEESHIDRLASEDVMIRLYPPENSFQIAWNNLLYESKQIVKKFVLIGFHSTRLTDFEIGSIEKGGLSVLKRNLFNQRITKLFDDGLITDSAKRELSNRNNVDDGNRSGLLWFVHCLSTLKDESGLIRLLKYWGGEALYRLHLDSDFYCSILQNIGVPCIILGLLSPSDIDESRPLEEKMIRLWKESFENDPYYEDTDTSVKRQVDILKVISINDPLFYELTECNRWEESLL